MYDVAMWILRVLSMVVIFAFGWWRGYRARMRVEQAENDAIAEALGYTPRVGDILENGLRRWKLEGKSNDGEWLGAFQDRVNGSWPAEWRGSTRNKETDAPRFLVLVPAQMVRDGWKLVNPRSAANLEPVHG